MNSKNLWSLFLVLLTHLSVGAALINNSPLSAQVSDKYTQIGESTKKVSLDEIKAALQGQTTIVLKLNDETSPPDTVYLTRNRLENDMGFSLEDGEVLREGEPVIGDEIHVKHILQYKAESATESSLPSAEGGQSTDGVGQIGLPSTPSANQELYQWSGDLVDPNRIKNKGSMPTKDLESSDGQVVVARIKPHSGLSLTRRWVVLYKEEEDGEAHYYLPSDEDIPGFLDYLKEQFKDSDEDFVQEMEVGRAWGRDSADTEENYEYVRQSSAMLEETNSSGSKKFTFGSSGKASGAQQFQFGVGQGSSSQQAPSGASTLPPLPTGDGDSNTQNFSGQFGGSPQLSNEDLAKLMAQLGLSPQQGESVEITITGYTQPSNGGLLFEINGKPVVFQNPQQARAFFHALNNHPSVEISIINQKPQQPSANTTPLIIGVSPSNNSSDTSSGGAVRFGFEDQKSQNSSETSDKDEQEQDGKEDQISHRVRQLRDGSFLILWYRRGEDVLVERFKSEVVGPESVNKLEDGSFEPSQAYLEKHDLDEDSADKDDRNTSEENKNDTEATETYVRITEVLGETEKDGQVQKFSLQLEGVSNEKSKQIIKLLEDHVVDKEPEDRFNNKQSKASADS